MYVRDVANPIYINGGSGFQKCYLGASTHSGAGNRRGNDAGLSTQHLLYVHCCTARDCKNHPDDMTASLLEADPAEEPEEIFQENVAMKAESIADTYGHAQHNKGHHERQQWPRMAGNPAEPAYKAELSNSKLKAIGNQDASSPPGRGI